MYISNKWRNRVLSNIDITIYTVDISYIAGAGNLFSLGAFSITPKSTGYYLYFLSPHVVFLQVFGSQMWTKEIVGLN